MNALSDAVSTVTSYEAAASSPIASSVVDARIPLRSLREYQRQLAERTRSAQSARATACRQLGFIAGACGWLIDLGDAAEIMPVPAMTRVPGTQPWFAGVFNHRGRLHGVVDFTVFLGHQALPPKTSDRLIVLSDRYPVSCSLRVTAVSGLMDVSGEADPHDDVPEEASPQKPQWQGQLSHKHGRAWRRLELQALIADPRFADAAIR